MPSRYHPIEDGLWNDSHLEGCPFEEKGFFAFLCSNERQRPAGIYRATDAQLAADTGLPEKRVRAYLADLTTRGRIHRDGSWLFVKNYFKRQPKQDRLLLGARYSVESCDSEIILKSFAEHYPMFRKWSTDRLETVARRVNGIVSSEQSRAEQLQSRAEEEGSDRTPEASAALDHSLKAILDECPHLSLVNNGVSSGFWDQVLGACEPYPMADGRWLGAKLRAWNQWFESNPSRRSRDRKRLESRLMGWLTRDLEALARRRA